MAEKRIGSLSVKDVQKGFRYTEKYFMDAAKNAPGDSSIEWQDRVCESFRDRMSPAEVLQLREDLTKADPRELERANRIPLREALDISGYPVLLASGVKANFYEGYKLNKTIFQEIVSVESSTKREERYGGLFETQLPTEVLPGENYLDSNLGEKVRYIANHKYGKILSLDMELIWHDQQGQILRKARDLGRGARLHQESTVINYLIDADGDNYRTSSAAAGTDIYTTGQVNLLTTALSASQLEVAIQTMRRQTDDNGNPVLVMPDTFLGPLQLEGDIHRILKAQGRTAVANQDNDQYNYLKEQFGGSWRILTSPFFSADDANDWYLMDRSMGSLIYQEVLPITVVEETGDSGSMFDRDVKRFKVMNYFGVGLLDHRAVLGNRVS